MPAHTCARLGKGTAQSSCAPMDRVLCPSPWLMWAAMSFQESWWLWSAWGHWHSAMQQPPSSSDSSAAMIVALFLDRLKWLNRAMPGCRGLSGQRQVPHHPAGLGVETIWARDSQASEPLHNVSMRSCCPAWGYLAAMVLFERDSPSTLWNNVSTWHGTRVQDGPQRWPAELYRGPQDNLGLKPPSAGRGAALLIQSGEKMDPSDPAGNLLPKGRQVLHAAAGYLQQDVQGMSRRTSWA